MTINGNYILRLGFKPGPHIPAMIYIAKKMFDTHTTEEIKEAIKHLAPKPKIPLDPIYSKKLYGNINIDNNDSYSVKNYNNVLLTLNEALKTPMTKKGAYLPDACPAGSVGTIPVGGVIASEAIHPGMHSADVCCSVAVTIFRGNVLPKEVLNRIHEVTHFGPGGRTDNFSIPNDLMDRILANPFTKDLTKVAKDHLGTQGDGNHFAFVGTVLSSDRTALVTHHGSRGFGAGVFKAGMRVAEKFRKRLSPKTLKQNAWIPADTREGEDYWEALQIVRDWTKLNHFLLHDAASICWNTLYTEDRFWNEHNFVFRKPDGLFYHAKGATPAFDNWADDASGLTLIPLNMAEPVLITKGLNNDSALGFSPHGAGRNYSRTQHKKMNEGRSTEDIFNEETKELDIRFFSNNIDISELPSAYKNAKSIKKLIKEKRLAKIVDEIIPYGSIMAGNYKLNTNWKNRK